MKLEAGKEMDRRCVINWLLEIYRHPNVAFHRHSDEQQREYAHDAIVLLNDDCRNCKLECLSQKYCKRECLLQKYNELKEKYDALLKEQKAVEPICQIIFDVPYYICGSCKTMLNMYAVKAKYCSQCGRPVEWE